VTQPDLNPEEDLRRPGGGTTSAALKTRDERYDQFLQELERTGNVTLSAKVAGVSRRNIYKLRDADEEFREEWDEAIDARVEKLEAEADRRAVEGVETPVFYKGERCDGGDVREYSDTLLMFRLKALKPEKYRHEAFAGQHAGQGAMEFARALRDAALAAEITVPAPTLPSSGSAPAPKQG
jgi:hypothetical protein